MEQKKLYVRQSGVPDNHVDATFMQRLEKNVHVTVYHRRELIMGACHVHQHWSSMILFLVLFAHQYNGRWSATYLHMLNNALLGTIYLFWMFHVRLGKLNPKTRNAKKQVAKAAILLIMTILGLSPVLRTLTEDISTDTICTLTGLLVCINLMYHNYGEEREAAPNPVALNAAVFASVMLASRLDSKAQVFGLVSLAIIWFSLFPIARCFINQRWNPQGVVALTLFLSVLTGAGLYQVHQLLLYSYFALSVFLLVVCPLWYFHLQKYKNNIHGPWDEAKVDVSKVQI